MKMKMKVLARSVVLVMCLGMLSVTLAGCAGTSTKQYFDDSAITAKVKAALATDSGVSAMHVHVTTALGVVELTGSVKSKAERNKAQALARTTPGVKSVTNKLLVKAI